MYVCMCSIRIQVVSYKGNDICLYLSRKQLLNSSSKLKRLLRLKFPCACALFIHFSYSLSPCFPLGKFISVPISDSLSLCRGLS